MNWRVTLSQVDRNETFVITLDESVWSTGVRRARTPEEVIGYCDSVYPGSPVLRIDLQTWNTVYLGDNAVL